MIQLPNKAIHCAPVGCRARFARPLVECYETALRAAMGTKHALYLTDIGSAFRKLEIRKLPLSYTLANTALCPQQTFEYGSPSI